MPSTISTSVSSDLFSSTVMTPSLPTFCIACAIILPIAASPLAETVPTCATSEEEATGLARFSRSLTTAPTAMSMPRFKSIGFMPAATDLAPSRTIAWASTVAVVVPSPAMSLVFEATSRTICAPMFSNLSSSSISFATVTPSLVMRGAPKLLSSTTLRPLGPSVTFTALARVSTPRSIFSRASPEKRTSLAAIDLLLLKSVFHPEGHARSCVRVVAKDEADGAVDPWGPSCETPSLREGSSRTRMLMFSSGDDAHDVGLLHDQELLAVELDLGARPLAEQHLVADLEIDRDQLSALVASTRPDGDHLALLRLLLGAVRNDDAAGGLFLGFDAAHDDAVVQGTEFRLGHGFLVAASAAWGLKTSMRKAFGTHQRRVPKAAGT